MRTDQFRYVLPESAIAQQPVEPRHHARLLDADRLADLRFDDLPLLLSPGDLLVVNSTRVRPARLLGNKEPTGGRPTGGKVEALLLRRLDGDHWEALVRPARRLREGSAVRFGPLQATVTAGPTDGRVVLRMGTADGIDVDDLLAQVGEVPLPPYIHTPLSDPERYQTVFAKVPGSAAAPTAGLHFTPRVLEAVGEAGVEVAEVDLEVGLDSFRPITTPDISGHRMHHERFSVPEPTAQAVEATRRRGGRVVAVGTTVVRALESAALADGRVRATSEDT
ncbi:MAG: S-adenosylmethionine:tRNA ribosyltransferase-isomerase, partial [Actinomycetota bacterium]|nr:S-adenosylmethionine:tRNA ribosyltransferase-isomerase [Actinomycetota bacterium]